MRAPVLVFAGLMAAPAVHAAEPARADTSRLDEVIVTASRRPEALRDIAASVSTIARPTFEAKATRFIGEELRGLPGVSLKTNDVGTYTDITIRGVPNRIHNDTLVVMMDGVPFVTGDDEVDLEQLPFGAVGRVDVVRGPMSALYGRGAIAGTINYVTRTVGDEPLAEVQGSIGSHGWRSLGALAQTPTVAGGALLVSAEIQDGDGWRDRTAREEQSLFLKHRHDLAPWARLVLTGTWVDTDQHLAGELPVNAAGEPIPLPGGRRGNWNEDDAGFAKRMLTGTAALETTLSESLSGRTTLHRRQSKTSARQGFFNPFDPAAGVVTFTGFQVDGDTDTLFAEQQLDWRIGPVRLLAGASTEQVKAHHVETWTGEFDFGPKFYAQSRDIATGQHVDTDAWTSDRLLDARSRARSHAVHVQGDLDWGPATLTAGGRFDRFSRRVDYGPSRTGFGENPTGRVRDTDQRFSPKASVTWRLGDRATAYAAYGAGFSPAFGPLWSFQNRDRDLDPELADNWEAGIKADTLDGALTISATAYLLKRRDLLQLIPVGGTARTLNAGRQRSQGLEMEALADLDAVHEGLGLSLTYGFTDAEWTRNRFLEPGTDRPFDFTGKDVAGVPRHSGRVELVQEIEGLGLTARAWVDLSGDYAYDNANTVRAGGHALWNAALTWAPTDALEVTLTGRNLFDRVVNTVVSNNDGPFAFFPQPPRELFLTVKARF